MYFFFFFLSYSLIGLFWWQKREKKRWLFRKTSTNNSNNNNNNAPETPPQRDAKVMEKRSPAQQKRHAVVEINIPTSAATIIQTAFRAYVVSNLFICVYIYVCMK